MSEMIPTVLKSQISKELSFPLGAMKISEALEGVPQYSCLTLAFYPHWDQTPSQTRRLLDAGESLRVMEATYRNIRPGRCGSRNLIHMGWYDETWGLAVYPVPRDVKAVVADLLLTAGLPSIRRWLEIERPESWCDGRHHCRLVVRLVEEGVLSCEYA